MNIRTDLAVVGSGFGGSLVALIARRLGLSVALLERGSHPRFAIGESSSPLANLLLEALCNRYGLDRVRPLSKWGPWRRAYPEIGCGLKRGFTFYGHSLGSPTAPLAGDDFLVAASPRDEIADTHWYRPDFDDFLMREAREAGALYFDQTALRLVTVEEGSVSLEAERLGRRFEVRSRLLVDASGPRGFLWRAFDREETTFEAMPPTCGLYTHFRGVRRMDSLRPDSAAAPPPYHPDDAALHHVFPGGWIWVLRFDNGITSAGVAATEACARAFRLAEGEAGWARLLAGLPEVEEQFRGAESILPFVFRAPLPYRARHVSGPGWTLLPSATAFVDPLLSTGFPLTLLGIERLSLALERDWGTPRLAAALERDAERTLFEADAAALLIAALYASFADFPLFCALSKLYFAAASFSEACRRLSRPERAGSFLCADHPDFGAALAACCRRALALAAGPENASDRDELFRAAARAIEPIDIAGLSDQSRGTRFPVLAEDLRRSAPKLGATREEIDEMLERSGFFEPSTRGRVARTGSGESRGEISTRRADLLQAAEE